MVGSIRQLIYITKKLSRINYTIKPERLISIVVLVVNELRKTAQASGKNEY